MKLYTWRTPGTVYHLATGHGHRNACGVTPIWEGPHYLPSTSVLDREHYRPVHVLWSWAEEAPPGLRLCKRCEASAANVGMMRK